MLLSLRRILLLGLPVLILAAACTAPVQVDARSKASHACGNSDAVDDKALARSFAELTTTSDLERAESLLDYVGSAFQSDACLVVSEARRAGLSADQLGRVLSAVPPDTVDKPCVRSDILASRLRRLSTLPEANESFVHKVSNVVKQAVDQELKACGSTENVRKSNPRKAG